MKRKCIFNVTSHPPYLYAIFGRKQDPPQFLCQFRLHYCLLSSTNLYSPNCYVFFVFLEISAKSSTTLENSANFRTLLTTCSKRIREPLFKIWKKLLNKNLSFDIIFLALIGSQGFILLPCSPVKGAHPFDLLHINCSYHIKGAPPPTVVHLLRPAPPCHIDDCYFIAWW